VGRHEAGDEAPRRNPRRRGEKIITYPYRVPLAVPYWTGATYRGILRAILSGSVVDGAALQKLEALIRRQLGVEDAILSGSGSFALEITLRALGVREGDEVVIPTFCCTAVVPPILAAGAIPVLADVGEELNLTAATVAAVLTERTKAIIVPHLFGNPADIQTIIDLTRVKNIRVIDDAAQALGATIDGRLAGSLGDAGILSFGNEKVCSGLGGGVLVSNQIGMFGRVAGVRLSPPEFSPTLKYFFSTLIFRRWRRWTFPIARTRTSPDDPPIPYRRERMSNLNAAVASSLMRTLGENIAARRARVGVYQELLGKEERVELIPHRSGSACLTQVVRVLPRRRGDDPAARLIQALGGAGYEVQGSYVPIHLLSPYEKFLRAPLPYAERVWADLVELPCEPGVSLDDVERIAAIVKQVA
jgi:dTDP-4-amino-4,6-dideoxygalactose transaminase